MARAHNSEVRRELTPLRLALRVLLVALVALPAAAAQWTLSGDLNCHDPGIWKESGTWWIARTWGAGIGMAYSKDGRAWSTGAPIWQNGLTWWHTYNGNTAWTWAPSLVDYKGKALCYYAVSTFGSQVSAIGLATASSIADGDWSDQGAILSSGTGAPFNAIDPCFTTDAAGGPWLSFGSFWNGIYVTALDPGTFKPTGNATNIASNSAGIENSQIVFWNGYYYLFASVGTCCDGASSTYHIVVGRSAAITGPYVDRNGVAMLSGGGTTLDSGGGRYIAPGGESIYDDGGAWVCARHELDGQNGYSTVLFINDLYWDGDGWPTYLATEPALTGQPLAASVAAGSAAALYCPASNAASYQWFKDGAIVAGATGPTYFIPAAGVLDAGAYTCTVSNAAGTVSSQQAALAVLGGSQPGRLVNMSCRGVAGTGAAEMIAGFHLGGAGTSGLENVLIRAAGPSLAPFGVAGALQDPALQLVAVGSQASVGADVGWNGDPSVAAAATAVGAFAWPSSSADSALLTGLQPGGYTALISGHSGDTGVALMEVYDAVPDAQRDSSTPRPINLSARVQVQSGPTPAVVGFVIGGPSAATVLIRASGPALAGFNLSGVLPDTTMQLWAVSGTGNTLLDSAAGWTLDPVVAAVAQAVGAFSWSSGPPADTAMLVTLPPGPYTAVVGGANNEAGIVLLEVYEVP